MSGTEDNKKIILAAMAAIERGDTDGMFALTREDFRHFIMHATPQVRSREQLRGQVVGRIHDAVEGGHMALTLKTVIAEGDRVVTLAKGATRTKNGFDYNNEYCMVWTLEDGKIIECREYLDTALAGQFREAVDAYWREKEGAQAPGAA